MKSLWLVIDVTKDNLIEVKLNVFLFVSKLLNISDIVPE